MKEKYLILSNTIINIKEIVVTYSMEAKRLGDTTKK